MKYPKANGNGWMTSWVRPGLILDVNTASKSISIKSTSYRRDVDHISITNQGYVCVDVCGNPSKICCEDLSSLLRRYPGKNWLEFKNQVH